VPVCVEWGLKFFSSFWVFFLGLKFSTIWLFSLLFWLLWLV
jgi:hypothetical protein